MAVIAAFAVPHPPLIVPAVGRGDEKHIQVTVDAYKEVACRIAELAPDTIVLTSPHATLYSDYFHISPGEKAWGSMERFRQPQESMEVTYDSAFVEALVREVHKEGVNAGTEGEREPELDHASFVPLFFVNQAYRDYKLVRIGLSGQSSAEHYRLGQCIARAAEVSGRRTVFIASGDLSHRLLEEGSYGFAPEGPEFDERVTRALGSADFLDLLELNEALCDAAGECGLRSFQIMAGALDRCAVTHRLLSYEGPFGVGYGVAAFEVTGTDASRDFGEQHLQREQERLAGIKRGEDAYVQLARLSLETYVNTGRYASFPSDLPEEMLDRQAGTFVSLKKHGQLRGCIGTIGPVCENVAAEIVRNAVCAGCEDPRFEPVRQSELGELVYSVDVLGRIEAIDSPSQLDVKRYGVIVSNGRRRGLLLPNLDGVTTVEQQIAISREKAGIGKYEDVTLERFEVVRHA